MGDREVVDLLDSIVARYGAIRHERTVVDNFEDSVVVWMVGIAAGGIGLLATVRAGELASTELGRWAALCLAASMFLGMLSRVIARVIRGTAIRDKTFQEELIRLGKLETMMRRGKTDEEWNEFKEAWFVLTEAGPRWTTNAQRDRAVMWMRRLVRVRLLCFVTCFFAFSAAGVLTVCDLPPSYAPTIN